MDKQNSSLKLSSDLVFMCTAAGDEMSRTNARQIRQQQHCCQPAGLLSPAVFSCAAVSSALRGARTQSTKYLVRSPSSCDITPAPGAINAKGVARFVRSEGRRRRQTLTSSLPLPAAPCPAAAPKLTEDHRPFAREASPLHVAGTAGALLAWCWPEGDAWNATAAAAAETERTMVTGATQRLRSLFIAST